MIDIEKLLKPISDDNFSGENLEYDNSFLDLEEESKGEPDREIRVKDPSTGEEVDRIILGKEPNFDLIIEKSIELFSRSKDLRIASHLCYALVKKLGLLGLSKGLSLINEMLSNHWDSVHPQLLEDDDFDPFMRLNALRELFSNQKLLKALQQSPLAESRATGRFTVRDIDVANGSLSPLEGQNSVDINLLKATIANPDDSDSLSDRLHSVQQAIELVENIQSTLQEHDIFFGNELSSVKVLLGKITNVLDQSGSEQLNASDESNDMLSTPQSNTTQLADQIATRAEASRQLKKISDFLKSTEPAHPAPLLIDRAIQLLDMDFLTIIEHLVPDALREIRQIGGIKDNE